jgi:CheY-like chemotaxis protein
MTITGGTESEAQEGPLRALVVDDEAPMRLLYRTNLEAEGLEVMEAANGLEAIDLATERRPEVAVLDIWMPDLDGFGVAEKLRELHDGLFDLVFVSAGSQPELAEKAARYDGRLIEKPFDPLEFGLLVRRLAEATRARSARLADDARALRAEAQHEVDRARRLEEDLFRAFGLDPDGRPGPD